jgi:hypothetical protein
MCAIRSVPLCMRIVWLAGWLWLLRMSAFLRMWPLSSSLVQRRMQANENVSMCVSQHVLSIQYTVVFLASPRDSKNQ